MVPTLIFLDFHILFQQIQFRLHWTAASHSWGHFKVQNGSSKNVGLGVSGLWAVFVIGLEVSKSSVSNFETGGLAVSQSLEFTMLYPYSTNQLFRIIFSQISPPILPCFASFGCLYQLYIQGFQNYHCSYHSAKNIISQCHVNHWKYLNKLLLLLLLLLLYCQYIT